MDTNTFARPAARVLIGTAALLSIPLIAMQFSNEVTWTASDFAVAGTLFLVAGSAYQFVALKAPNVVYRFAAALAVFTALFLIWINLAVGIIGSEDNPQNWIYVCVLAVEFMGVLISRLKARGMANAMFASAVSIAAIGVYAIVARLDDVPHMVGIHLMFTLMFTSAGLLFRRAAEA